MPIKLLSILLFLSSFTLSAFSMTPEEYCKIHSESGAPGSCSERGSCAVITSNLGTDECKVCSEGGCELSDCESCEE